jgi:hypothetical protein
MFPIEVFQGTIAKAVAIFERHAVGFHLTGGLTSVFYGEPRMTQDVDIVVDNQAIAAAIDAFIASLTASDFMFDIPSVRQAVASRGMFQLFDQKEALKLDIYPRELVPGELQRSERLEIFSGVELPVVSRADAAISKLIWVSRGSHKSRRDFRQLFRLASDANRQAIRELATQLGHVELMEELLNESDELS